MKRMIAVVLIVLLVLLGALGGAIWYAVSRMQEESVPTVPAPVGTNSPIPEMYVLGVDETPQPADETPAPIFETAAADEQIINILLVGGDARQMTTRAVGNADTMMLFSINRYTNTVTLLSFMRDGWVDIVSGASMSKGKLNAAYSTGGVGTLINTLNHNFGLDIQEYVAVGFENFTALIDAIGGIDVDLTAKEAYYINWKMDQRLLEVQDGTVHLSGEQALWYARNRTTPLAGDESGNDFSRVSRQQHLIELLLAKVHNEMNADMMFELIRFAIENCTTNLSGERMGELGGYLLMNRMEIVKAHVPFDGTWSYRQAGGISFDVVNAAGKIHTLLYPKQD